MSRQIGSAVVAIALLTAWSGCGKSPTERDPLDDEAMVRAKLENKRPQDAAREWFYPREIHDYLDGMDGIALRESDGAAPDTVYQLLDQEQFQSPAPTRVVDPIGDYDYWEILGRNTWMLWAGGNEGFWDWLSRQYGFLDFLHLIDSRNRSARFRDGGLINEPGMMQATSEDEFGLWLDVPTDPEVREWRRAYIRKAFGLEDPQGGASPAPGYGSLPAGPTPASMTGYPQGMGYNPKIPPPEIYGISSGVVGLRLFPNPNFDERARERWNARKYYSDPTADPNMVRPYRVGMACAFCHASYHPLKPPHDLVNPDWENISGNIGAQYLRMQPVFGNLVPRDNFIYHILESQPPGTVDTSLVPSDNINNPNSMNSVFNLAQRVLVSFRNPKEWVPEQSADLPAIWRNPTGDPSLRNDGPTGDPSLRNDVPPEALIAGAKQLWEYMHGNDSGNANEASLVAEIAASNEPHRRVPRILFDGADSIGAWGALARVYLNIGTNYEQWNTLHEPVVGFLPQKPFTIDNLDRHSVYWHATRLRVGPLRDYFLRVTPPMPLLAAEGAEWRAKGSVQMQGANAAERRGAIDTSKLALGREVFARNCIVCHSSVQPQSRYDELEEQASDSTGRPGAFWDHDPGRWLRDADYIDWALAAVEKPEFWRANYLSTDYRIPVTLVGTNSCRAMATNAVEGHLWANFSSDSYRRMPSVGPISFFNPYRGTAGADDRYTPRHATAPNVPAGGGGPGLYRVPTLVSIWTAAPLLHNNSLGLFNNDPSIDGRLAAFDDAMRKLLWPARRLMSTSYNEATPERLRRDHGLIWRTTQESYLTIGGAYLPRILGSRLAPLRVIGERWPWLKEVPPEWRPVPTGAALLLAFVLLWLARGKWMRRAGYTSIVAGLLAGALIYFLNGGFGGLRLGPIPKGTPVSLLANTNPDASPSDLQNVISVARKAFTEIESEHPDDARIDEIMRTEVAPALMAVSKCPDFVMDRGHYFNWFDNMTDADKDALIELLKTF